MPRRVVLVAVLAFVGGYAASEGTRHFAGTAAHAQSVDWQRLARDPGFRRAVLMVVDGNCYVELEGRAELFGVVHC